MCRSPWFEISSICSTCILILLLLAIMIAKHRNTHQKGNAHTHTHRHAHTFRADTKWQSRRTRTPLQRQLGPGTHTSSLRQDFMHLKRAARPCLQHFFRRGPAAHLIDLHLRSPALDQPQMPVFIARAPPAGPLRLQTLSETPLLCWAD